jgi:hypothetical protein
MKPTHYLISFLFIGLSYGALGQENPNSVLSKGIKYTIDERSTLSFHFGTQVWARYMQVNPGTRDVNGQCISDFYDVDLRRTRFSLYSSFLDDKFVVYTQFGMNGQTFSSISKPQIFFHDVWSAFQFFGGKLYAGMGLHGWGGVSRIGSVSYAKNIMLDHPGFNFPNLGKTDQAGRQVGIFIKGNVAGFNYRFSLDNPFVRNELDSIAFMESVYAPNSNTAVKGYVFYSFLDEEKFKSSYVPMSYLGKKKVLNLGAGFDFHPKSMASLNASSQQIFHDKKNFGIDLFLDYPFTNKSVLTLYTTALFYDYGPNHVRTYGVMNPVKTGDYAQGGGNYHYNVGTGTIYFGLAGFILPESWQPFSGKFQPIVAVHYKDFEGLNEASLQYDLGINYLISGHNAKVNLQYSSWNFYQGTSGFESDATISSQKGMLVLQVQMYL